MEIIANIQSELEAVRRETREGVKTGYRTGGPDKYGYVLLVWVADEKTIDSRRYTENELSKAAQDKVSLLDIMREDRRFEGFWK